jgi:hypothetical protein
MSEQLTNRRRFLATATAAGLTATLAGKHVAHGASRTPWHKGHGMSNSEMEQCIENCRNCEATCISTLQYCLKAGGVHLNSDHVTALQDCTTMCRTSADLMLRGSSLVGDVCGVCSQACTTCAESCDAISGDATMAQCAETCRTCADSCASMAG